MIKNDNFSIKRTYIDKILKFNIIIAKRIISVKVTVMKDLTKGNIYKTFLLFAIPIVLAGVLSQCYSVVNTIIAGRLLGDNALATIGAVSPLETFTNSVFCGFGTGVAIYTGHLFGAKDYRRLKSVIISNFVFISAAVIALSVVLYIFRYSIYLLLKIDPLIMEDCNRYFIVHSLGKVFLIFSACGVYFVNSMGDSKFPLYMSFLSTFMNIGLGVMLITVFDMGVEGLALANILSAFIIDIIYVFKFSKVFKKLNIGKYKIYFELKSVKNALKYSVSTMCQQSIMYFSGLILSPLINGIGGAASASYTVTLRIYDVNSAIYQNSARTIGSYTAQCYGAKKYHLLKKGLKVGFIQNVAFVMPVLLVSVFMAMPVARLFYGANADITSVNYTVTFLRYCMPFLFFNIIANLFHHFFRGIGLMKALLITTIVGSAVRILISWLLIPYWGIYGYYVGWVMSWVLDGAVGLLIYYFGSWKKQLV